MNRFEVVGIIMSLINNSKGREVSKRRAELALKRLRTKRHNIRGFVVKSTGKSWPDILYALEFAVSNPS